MSFLNPFFLIGGIALAVPVLIHLVRRERSEVVPFSSLMFLLKVPKRSVRQQMLKNLLLMALRLLLLALLVGLFARPYLVQSATPDAAQSGQGRGYVMLLDNSYSMRYGSNFATLKTEAIERIDAMAGNDRMAVIAFNTAPAILQQPSSDKGQLRAAVETLEPSYSGTRFFEAFALADRMMTEFGGQEKNLIVISDFQRTGWNRTSRESIVGHDVKMEAVPVGVEQSNNIGIDNVAVDSTSFERIYTGRVVARIRNYRRDKEVNIPVVVSINDKDMPKKNVTVPPASTVLAEFTGFELPLGVAKGKVRIESDDPLPVDNEFLFTIDRREKLSILVVDAGRPRQSLFLQAAFTASPGLPFNVKVASAQAVTPDDLKGQDVLILNDVPRVSDPVRNQMIQLRKAGQGQIVILGQNAELGWWGSLDGFPVKPLQKIEVAKDRGKPSVFLTTFDRNHGIFKPLQSAARFTLNSAPFLRYTEVELKPNASAVAKFENGSPALVESPADDRGMLVFTSSVDGLWNEFPRRPSFPPFFYEIARYLSHYNAANGWYALGEGISILGSLDGGLARAITPAGETESFGELKAGEQRFYTPREPGFHDLRVGRETQVLAVNPPSNEGNLDSMLPEDLFASVQSTEAEARQAGTFSQDDKLEYARRQMGWWYLLLFALAAGLVELYIANKRSQRARAVIPAH